jgi:predicted HAD superfamily Cof-like phosphohydrolase
MVKPSDQKFTEVILNLKQAASQAAEYAKQQEVAVSDSVKRKASVAGATVRQLLERLRAKK